jgi:hypothetical protein
LLDLVEFLLLLLLERLVRALVGVALEGKLAICGLDGSRIGVLGHTEGYVGVRRKRSSHSRRGPEEVRWRRKGDVSLLLYEGVARRG